MSNEIIQKQDIVLLLIKKATIRGIKSKGISGKKALQKSLYLFNLKFPIFNYRWGDYGPLCMEIQHITKDLVDQGYITITDVSTRRKDAVIKNLQIKDTSLDIFASSDIEKELDDIVSFIEGRLPRELELLASVHFLADRQKEIGKYSAEFVFEKLTQLKPDANFTRKDVEWAISILEGKKYL